MRPRTLLIFLSLMLSAISCTSVEKEPSQPAVSFEAASPSPASYVNTEPQRISWSNLSPQLRELLRTIDDPEVLAVLNKILNEESGESGSQAWRDQIPPLALLATGNRDDLEIAFLELEAYLRKQDSKIQNLESRVRMLENALKKQSD